MSTITAPTAEPGLERLARDEFLDLVCDDVDLLRAEFDALIAASWDDPPGRRPPSPPQRPAELPHAYRRPAPVHSGPEEVVDPSTAVARQRGPPRTETG
ncbi:hypothetical protein FB561_4190 [Kribbella amoyensis]|uniref:Uncharacterized protein n=1 Tax=Kribbella amoyensis TaxID=996641 RepID=A0A561BW27_9ACTN|nr:hypothetical protein [Kribbella amoyensis]TWD83037.1 hypothetical protein FB561_4190 [Kribbella amoyensis]